MADEGSDFRQADKCMLEIYGLLQLRPQECHSRRSHDSANHPAMLPSGVSLAIADDAVTMMDAVSMTHMLSAAAGGAGLVLRPAALRLGVLPLPPPL